MSLSDTNRDAAPAAKATKPESSVPLGSDVAPANTTSPPTPGVGETSASARFRRKPESAPGAQSPAGNSGGGLLRDVARPDTKGQAAGGPEPIRHGYTIGLITRLSRWSHDVDAVPASDLMDEAAGELTRLLGTIDTYSEYAALAEKRLRQLEGRKLADD